MTNFEHLRNETRTFDGMLDTLSKIWAAGGSGCILDHLTETDYKCPKHCPCKFCIGTWLSNEGSEIT